MIRDASFVDQEMLVQPIVCRRCGTQVLVEKNSPAHTAIQWADSKACVEFGKVPDVTTRARMAGCTELRVSIDDAVRCGRIEVTAG